MEKVQSTWWENIQNILQDNSYIPQDILTWKQDDLARKKNDIKDIAKKSLWEFTFSTTNDNSRVNIKNVC